VESAAKKSRYGAHLSKEQVAVLVAPHPDALGLVGSWLAHQGLPNSSISIDHGGSWLILSGVPVSQADALLGASYQLYRHNETGEVVLRTISYALPEALHEHVRTVAPTTYFGSPRALRRTSQPTADGPSSTLPDREVAASLGPEGTIPASCSTVMTPSCLRTLYNTGGYVPLVPNKNQIGIAGYLGEYVSQSDLTEFMILFRTDGVSAQVAIVDVSGSNDQSHPGVEARVLLSDHCICLYNMQSSYRLTLTSNMPSR
jgi:tripeptidyl-peptidase-1